jgi:hypothetical protein
MNEPEETRRVRRVRPVRPPSMTVKPRDGWLAEARCSGEALAAACWPRIAVSAT